MKKLYNTETILKTHYGDQEFVRSMAELFIEHLPAMSTELQKASVKKDWESLYFYAHKMKATIDLFSIDSLSDIIRKLEKQGKTAADSKTLKQDVNYVADIINACVAQLKNEFALADH
jgi:HPt (histidine-containing phosphotransfer) domain-containing protein